MAQAIVANAVATILAAQEERLRSAFASKLEFVRTQVNALTVQVPLVHVCQRAVLNPEIKSDVKLDIVKSLPTFNGSHDEYVSWRQAAFDAFKGFHDSVAHYEVLPKKGTDDNGIRKKRLVTDFKELKERTVADRYPKNTLPILAYLGKAKFFTTLDLNSGYRHIYLAERDREKTSFSVNGGTYEFCRLPFGLKNAGSIFQRAIDDLLREEIGKICYVYVGDVIIFF